MDGTVCVCGGGGGGDGCDSLDNSIKWVCEMKRGRWWREGDEEEWRASSFFDSVVSYTVNLIVL